VRNLVGHALWLRRYSLLGWLTGTLAIGALMIAVYPVVRDSAALEQLLKRFPPMMMEFMGIDPEIFTTGIGFVQAQLYTLMAPLLMVSFSIGVGAGATAGEEQEGTADLLLAHPVMRWQLVLSAFLVMALLSALLAGALAAMLALGNALVDLKIPAKGIFAINLGVWLLGLFFGSVAMVVGAWRGRRRVAAGVAAGLVFLSFFLHGLAPIVEKLREIGQWNPFHFYLKNNPVKEGVTSGHAVLAGATLALLAAAALLFSRRDIGVDAPVFVRRRSRSVKGSRSELKSVYRKTIWDRRVSIWFWMLGLCGLAAATMAFWPSISGMGLEKMLGAVPKEVFAAFGVNDPATMLTPAGFLTSRVYASVGLILVVVFSIATGTSLVAGEVRRKTIDLALSMPITRRRFLLEGYAAMATLVALLVVALFATVVAGDAILGLGISFRGMLGANLGLGLLGLFFGTVALAAGAATGRTSAAKGVAATVAIAAFLMNALGAAVPAMGWMRPASPVYWFLANSPPLNRGLRPAMLLALLGAVILTAYADWCFSRRDIAAV